MRGKGSAKAVCCVRWFRGEREGLRQCIRRTDDGVGPTECQVDGEIPAILSSDEMGEIPTTRSSAVMSKTGGGAKHGMRRKLE
eukprot:3113780-Rhodomonas_salina.1